MGGVVYIPVQNSEEEVRVALDQLPRDATDMIDILKAEQAPLHLWLIIAVGCSLRHPLPLYIEIIGLCFLLLSHLQSLRLNSSLKYIIVILFPCVSLDIRVLVLLVLLVYFPSVEAFAISFSIELGVERVYLFLKIGFFFRSRW